MSDQTSPELIAPKSLSGETFPLESFKDAARDLRRPFTANAVKFKLLRSWGNGGEIATYIDQRLVVERLNLVLPHLWEEGDPAGNPPFELLAGGKLLLCRLTVDGITRVDVGEHSMGKGMYSDALKRAAVKFGVGVSLYAIPAGKVDKGYLESFKNSKGKEVTLLSPKGVSQLRGRYQTWLDKIGVGVFGEALDHGDVEDAAGDVEVESEADQAQATLAVDEGATEKLTDAKAVALIEGAEKLYKDLPKEAKKDRPPAAFRRELTSAWHSHEELEKLISGLEAASV